MEKESLHNYDDIKSALRSMKQVSAPDNFEADLMRMINQGENAPKKRGLLDKLFTLPTWVYSGVAVSMATVIIFFVMQSGSNKNDLATINPNHSISSVENESKKEVVTKEEKKEEKKTEAIAKVEKHSPAVSVSSSSNYSNYKEEVKPEVKEPTVTSSAIVADKVAKETPPVVTSSAAQGNVLKSTTKQHSIFGASALSGQITIKDTTKKKQESLNKNNGK